MKKLPLFLALALALSFNAFAQKGSKKHREYLSDAECARYEIKNGKEYYKDGKRLPFGPHKGPDGKEGFIGDIRIGLIEGANIENCYDKKDTTKNRVKGHKKYRK